MHAWKDSESKYSQKLCKIKITSINNCSQFIERYEGGEEGEEEKILHT